MDAVKMSPSLCLWYVYEMVTVIILNVVLITHNVFAIEKNT